MINFTNQAQLRWHLLQGHSHPLETGSTGDWYSSSSMDSRIMFGSWGLLAFQREKLSWSSMSSTDAEQRCCCIGLEVAFGSWGLPFPFVEAEALLLDLSISDSHSSSYTDSRIVFGSCKVSTLWWCRLSWSSTTSTDAEWLQLAWAWLSVGSIEMRWAGP